MEEEVVLSFISLGTALSRNAKANLELSMLTIGEGSHEIEAEMIAYIMTYTWHIVHPLLLVPHRMKRMSI